jgi:ferric-dicitrate binding protein FerR (iron transport regulator)
MNKDNGRELGGPDDVGRLIAQAGRRPAPGLQMQESVRAAVEQAWNESISRRNFRRRSLWLSAAASVAAIAVGLLWFGVQRSPIATPTAVATLVAARGEVSVGGTAGHQLVVAGSRLSAGATVRTGASGFVLLTVASVGVRIGPDTTLHLERPGRVSLAAGRMYAETAVPAASGPSLIVDTPFGRVSHLGTQFQILVAAGSMDVSVRSGRVKVTEGDGQAQVLTRGEGVELLRGGAVHRIAVTPYGASWDWVDTLEPDFPIAGRSLADFLAWYTRETGLKLVLVGRATSAALSRTTLSGSIAGLTPNEALAAVMATTGFGYDMSVPGELRVRLHGAAAQGT